jgi:hypothetical protein
MKDTMLLQTYTNSKNKTNRYYRKRLIWTASQAPCFTMRDRATPNQNPVALVSLPSYNRIMDPALSINSTTWERVIIKLKDPTNKVNIKMIISDFKS